MIIEDIISKIITQLSTTDLFEKTWGLCEIIKDGNDNSYPAYYKGANEYDKAVNDWNAKVGVSYIRKNGDVTYVEIPFDSQTIDCSTQTELNLPLKIVCIVPKEHIPRDDEFADDYVALKVISVLNGQHNFLSGVDKSFLIVSSHTTDNQTILSEEFSGLDIVDVHYKYAYLSIQLTARIVVETSCLEPDCTPCYPLSGI